MKGTVSPLCHAGYSLGAVQWEMSLCVNRR